ncbi:DUF317 domain-containing protein [Streptomyces lavendulae]|uniref:DUF317 domain-containing protein n=1 Tax=Streptomyces lavendulae TaxID=1914 RepID=UPI0033D6EA07
MRIEFDHEARNGRDVAWTIAVYDSPVGERLWHATATVTTPTDLVQTLLDSLTSNESRWGQPSTDGALRPADATRTLLEARWTQTSSARYVAWQAPDGSSSLRLNTYAADNPASQLPAWSIIAGTDPNRPDWAIDLSPLSRRVPASDRSPRLHRRSRQFGGAQQSTTATGVADPACTRRRYGLRYGPPRHRHPDLRRISVIDARAGSATGCNDEVLARGRRSRQRVQRHQVIHSLGNKASLLGPSTSGTTVVRPHSAVVTLERLRGAGGRLQIIVLRLQALVLRCRLRQLHDQSGSHGQEPLVLRLELLVLFLKPLVLPGEDPDGCGGQNAGASHNRDPGFAELTSGWPGTVLADANVARLVRVLLSLAEMVALIRA